MENAAVLNGIDPDLLDELRSKGFDLDHLLFHGSDRIFDQFDISKVETADHIYTSPDPDTAGFYGKHLYLVAGRQDPQADLIDDWELITKIADTFADDFHDAVETDEDLAELADSLQDEVQTDHVAKIKADDPTVDDAELERLVDEFVDFDLEDAIKNHLKYKKALHAVAKRYVADLITSGELYDIDSRWQNTIMHECFGTGYNSVRFVDPSSTGDPISVVFDDPDNLQILKRIR